MNVIVRVVASLIATMIFASSAFAGNKDVFVTSDGKYNLSGNGEIAFRAFDITDSGVTPARVNADGTISWPTGKRLLRDANIGVKPTINNTLTGAVAPTGTRRILEVVNPRYCNNPRNPKYATYLCGYDTVLATTNWVKAQDAVAQNPGSFVSDWSWVGPAESGKLWVVNDNPDGVVNDPVLGLTGKYLSNFNLDPLNWQGSERTDVTISGYSRSVDFDNSRDFAYMPRTSYRTFQVRSVTTVTGPSVTNVANVQDSRLNSLVYEPTGEVFHLASSTYGNRVFVYNPSTDQVWDFIAPTGVVPNTDTSVDAHTQGAISGNTLFRVLSINGHTQTKVEVYDIPTRTQRASYIVNKKLASGGGIFGARPQISFDPRANTLWFATIFDGSLGYLDLTSGTFTNVPISQEAGVSVGATDVEVDTSRNVAYVSIARFQAVWQGAGTPWVNGSLVELDLATKQVVRQATLQVYPWSVAVVPTAKGTFVAVSNNALQTDGNGNFGTVSIIETTSFNEVSRMRTQRQPGPTAVELN